MTTLQTFFRAVVMLATLGIVAKAWHLYGPSVDEVRVISQRAMQVAEELLNEYRDETAPATDANDPRMDPRAPMAGPPTQQVQPVQLAAADSEGQVYAQQTVALSMAETAPFAPPAPLTAAVPDLTPVPTSPSGDRRLEAAQSRLVQLGVQEQRLEPWGVDGRLVRFCCSASWVDAPNYSRHFEAVAADPATAVEQVAAEVEAWRAAQNAAAGR
jgi:hypothetical protein